jgi:hypothetical protein
MFEIIKTYKQTMPSLRLIGIPYTDKDRDQFGSFSSQWEDWFRTNRFEALEKLESLPENENSYVGCMRMNDNIFEYWIGMFFKEDTPVPQDFQYVDISKGDIGVNWIYGSEANGEIYGDKPHNACIKKLEEQNWISADTWCFERYNCPRFTKPDEHGKVILDYCIYLK